MRQSSSSVNTLSGFTLIELLITVAILSIMLSTAVPSLQGFSERQEQRATVRLWLKNLAYLKSEAISQGKTIKLITEKYSSGYTAKAFEADGVTSKDTLIYNNTYNTITVESDNYEKATPIEFDNEGHAVTTGTLKFIQRGCEFATITINVAGQIISEHKEC